MRPEHELRKEIATFPWSFDRVPMELLLDIRELLKAMLEDKQL